MAVYKQKDRDPKTGELVESGIWWCEFSFAGKRYRESTKTTRKTLAGDYEKRRRLELQRQHATGKRTESSTRMLRTVKDAVKAYCAGYDCPNHRAQSIVWVNGRAPHLERHLGNVTLFDLTEDRIREYMRKRSEEGAGNRTINMELLCLTRAVGTTWRQLWPAVPKLDEPCDIGRALSPEEEGRLLGAASKNKSHFIYAFIRIALLTGMRCGEIRALQLRQLDLQKRELRVGHAKTPAGEGRGIPMSPELLDTISGRVAWLEKTFGKLQPDWYLFPFCERTRPIDPTRQVTTLKTSWESVRAAAKVECRLHDLRHTAATKMAENDTPEATMKALLGHMSQAMIERYSHVRMDAKRKALDSLTLATPIFGVPMVSPMVGSQRRLKVVGK
jgi:integrase